MPRLGDSGDEVRVDVVGKRVALRLGRRRRMGLRVRFGRALVLGDLDEVGTHPDLIAEAAEEEQRRRQTE
jgi:hypothetical protein